MISFSFRNRFNDFPRSLCFIERKSFSFQIQFSDIFYFSVNVSKKVFKRQCYETFTEKYNFWISIQSSFQKSLQRYRYSFFQANKFFRFDLYIYIKSIKYCISTYGSKMHMHEYSKIYVDRHIDIEIILHRVKFMNILSVEW